MEVACLDIMREVGQVTCLYNVNSVDSTDFSRCDGQG